ncbi:MAG: hypothetical protein PHS79_02200 [Patescibacteria group bacterium]|nr:hypothetical protein [Patescibacteria group bacterium]
MMRKYLIWLVAGPVIVLGALLGWNYMHKQALAQKALADAQAAELKDMPFLPSDAVAEVDKDMQNRQVLANAIKKFRAAKSFRTSITQTSANGTITGVIEYIKPLRLHAVLKTDDKKTLELIIVGETVYVRTSTNSWEMSNDAFAKDFGRSFFASMLITDDSISSFGIADDAPITLQANTQKRCTAFKTQYKQDDKMLDMSFCIDSTGSIAGMTTKVKDGEIDSSYTDYNDLFSIERPMMPLLTPDKPGAATSTAQ